jgi:hypothetical protein
VLIFVAVFGGRKWWATWVAGWDRVGVWARGEGVPLPLLLLSFSSFLYSFYIFAQFHTFTPRVFIILLSYFFDEEGR